MDAEKEVDVDLAAFKSFMEARGYTTFEPSEGLTGIPMHHYGCLGRIYKMEPGLFQSDLAQCTKCFKIGPVLIAADEDGQFFEETQKGWLPLVLFKYEEI